MKPTIIAILNDYLNLSGERDYRDFSKLYDRASKAQKEATGKEYVLLEYVKQKCKKGITVCAQYPEYETIHVIVEEGSIEDIEKAIEDADLSGSKPKKGASEKRKDLGKIVDHGKTSPGNSDAYWGREGIDLVFRPNDENVRKGEKIPYTYKYADIRYLEGFYGLKAFEFGNWLSQQDRLNYLSGLGLALYDLHSLLGFSGKQIGMQGKLSVAFGARGRGKALAHFEPLDFVINLTRYGRPKKLSSRTKNFRRVNLILQDGGVGSFAHEYAHALDFYSGSHVIQASEGQISGGRETDPSIIFPSAKKPKIQGLMDNLLNKIIWKGKNVKSDYYKRMTKGKTKEYFIRRNEIWARSFEVYVHFKLEKKKHKNIFLNKSKYAARYYLSFTEMKKLEKDFDALMAEIKKHL